MKLLLLLALSCVQTNSYKLPPISSFDKKLIISGSSYELSYLAISDTDSYFYLICNPAKFGVEKINCNVTIETPVSSNVTYKETCSVNLAVDKPRYENIVEVSPKPINDQRILLMYRIVDQQSVFKYLKLRVLRMDTCQVTETTFSVPHKKLRVHSSRRNIDVIYTPEDRKSCDAENCRFTFNVEGPKVRGPVPYLKKEPSNTVLEESLLLDAPEKGSFVHVITLLAGPGVQKPGNHGLLRVDPAGTSAWLIDGKHEVATSDEHELLGVCWTDKLTNVTCRQYDSKANMKFESKLNFFDPLSNMKDRWLKTHNLKEGGLLVVSGPVTGKNNPEFENFSLVKVQPNGLHGRPLEIKGLGFKCDGSFSNLKARGFQKIMVNVAEVVDEYCVQFICDQKEFDQQGDRSILKYSSKCLSKHYFSL